MPSNPNWSYGYIPTAEEWAQTWSGKADAGPAVPINQGGTGSITASGANYAMAQRGLIAATGTSAQLLTRYGVRTSVMALTVYLPPLSTALPGDWIDFADVDFNAGTNNITLSAIGSDLIQLYGSNSPSQALTISGVKCTLIAASSYWSMIV